MNRNAAFLFYTADFLVGTMDFTNEQVGKYIRLLCYQHQKGNIPPEYFNSVCNGDEKIRAKFRFDSVGNLYSERLKKESNRRIEFVKSRKRNLSGIKRMRSHMGSDMDKNIDDDKFVVRDSMSQEIMMRILRAYAEEKGIPQQVVNTAFIRRYARSAKGLYEECSECNIDMVISAIKFTKKQMDKNKLNWSLDTVFKWWEEFARVAYKPESEYDRKVKELDASRTKDNKW